MAGTAGRMVAALTGLVSVSVLAGVPLLSLIENRERWGELPVGVGTLLCAAAVCGVAGGLLGRRLAPRPRSLLWLLFTSIVLNFMGQFELLAALSAIAATFHGTQGSPGDVANLLLGAGLLVCLCHATLETMFLFSIVNYVEERMRSLQSLSLSTAVCLVVVGGALGLEAFRLFVPSAHPWAMPDVFLALAYVLAGVTAAFAGIGLGLFSSLLEGVFGAMLGLLLAAAIFVGLVVAVDYQRSGHVPRFGFGQALMALMFILRIGVPALLLGAVSGLAGAMTSALAGRTARGSARGGTEPGNG